MTERIEVGLPARGASRRTTIEWPADQDNGDRLPVPMGPIHSSGIELGPEPCFLFPLATRGRIAVGPDPSSLGPIPT